MPEPFLQLAAVKKKNPQGTRFLLLSLCLVLAPFSAGSAHSTGRKWTQQKCEQLCQFDELNWEVSDKCQSQHGCGLPLGRFSREEERGETSSSSRGMQGWLSWLVKTTLLHIVTQLFSHCEDALWYGIHFKDYKKKIFCH